MRNLWWRSLMCLILAVSTACAEDAKLVWPSGELSAHAEAWFEQLHGDDAAARAFFATHMAPNGMPIETRLERRRGMLEQAGVLVPLQILASEPTSMRVRVRTASGEVAVAMIQGEPESPHRILGVRIELGEDSGGGPGPAAAGPRLTDAEAVTEITGQLDASTQAGSFSGAVLLARSGKPLLERAWGEADRARHQANTPATRFNLGSIGKIFTRTALAQLAEAKKLSLDDRLSKYLPDFPHAEEITLAMLAAHRSGVGDFFNDAYDKTDHSKLRHNRDYLALIRDQPLWFPPGTQMRYSNGGYVLLGEVIAKASGEDYYEYLERHVFARAGMKSTSAPIEGDGTPGVARGYTTEGAKPGERVDNARTRPARGSAAGGSYSTLTDLLAFDQALLGARLAGPAWSEWVVGGPRPDPLARPAAGAPASFGFAGGAPGISSEWLHEGDRTLIVLTNLDPSTTKAAIVPLRAVVQRMSPDAPMP